MKFGLQYYGNGREAKIGDPVVGRCHAVDC